MTYEKQSEFSIGFVRSFARIFLSKIKILYIDRLSSCQIILQGELRKNNEPVFIMHDQGKLYYADGYDIDQRPDPISLEEFIHKILYEI